MADALTQVTLRPMSKKQYEPPADDWAGLAQNLFGIDLDKSDGDDDLLDKDMFKVEIPSPVEPTAPQVTAESVSFAEFTPVEATETPPSAPVAPPKVTVTKPKAATSSKPVVAKRDVEDDPFGAGILEEVVAVTAEADSPDEGLTLPEDFDDEGLTLASDFDDGLTLPLDQEDDGLTLAADDDDDLTFSSENIAPMEEVLDGDEDDDDTEDMPVAASDATQAARSESPRKRNPRRTREDAYWDMLENWEWEEIPDSDSPRSGGDRSPVRGGNRDRGGRGGDRGGRGGRSGGDRGGRDERPRSAGPARSEERPRRDESRPADATPMTPRSESGGPAARPRRDERPRDDRGPRPERRPDRDARRDEPRPAAASQSAAVSKASDDFGSGIFEEQSPPARTSSVPKPTAPAAPAAPAARPPREEAVAQSSQAADAVLRDSNRATAQSVNDELVWSEDNSDVRPAPVGSVVETSGLPAADVAGESDRMVSASDVELLDESEQRSRRPRRRRRRGGGGPMSETTTPPDGNEGTTFDLSEALSIDGETPDFIPSASADDSAMSAESAGEETEDATGEGPSSQRRGSRRRRRRRPGENAPVDVAPNTNSEVHAESETTGLADVYEDDEPILKPIAYSNVPSWEEALRYLLEPHLVGRNLGPDDEDDGLASDPRGSGGAEPISAPPPPPQRRRRGGGSGGGGGRGRRP